MTQEEKAKAYDMALEIARNVLDNTDDNYVCTYLTKEDIKEMYSRFFPELKESEDERVIRWIRKELEDKYVTDNIVNNVTAGKALAWLKKQGEKQKLYGTFVNVDEVREGFMNTIYSILSDDPTNDRANDIINAFDNLPSITISNV